jgi:chemotaxis protein MotA
VIALVGILVVFGSIIGGYLMEKGNMAVLLQPAELLIIGGAALGTLLIANPIHIIKNIVAGLLKVIKGSPYSKKYYMEALQLLNELFVYSRKQGATKLEQEIEKPEEGKVFSKYPTFLKDHMVLEYICDTIRMSLAGTVAPFDLDMLMEADSEVHHQEEHKSIAALNTVADALPGLGIVAAVLGVVITMGSLGGPPEEIGHKVAAALVGTFLGILLCYGLVSPLAANISKMSDDQNAFFRCLRAGVSGFVKGMPAILATESARRVIPHHLRPTMAEMEEAFRAAKAAPEGGAPANG